MSQDDYKATLQTLANSLSALMEKKEALELEQEALDREILKVRAAVGAIAMLVGDEAEQIIDEKTLFVDILAPDIGLTNAVRKVLREDSRSYGLTPLEVRRHLQKRRFRLDKYKNVMASIHTVLRRLKENDEVDIEFEYVGGKPAYKWKGGESKAEPANADKAASKAKPKTLKGKKKG